VQPRKAISFEAEAAELNLRNLYFPIFLLWQADALNQQRDCGTVRHIMRYGLQLLTVLFTTAQWVPLETYIAPASGKAVSYPKKRFV
jgi:hypothetical protein